MTNDPGALVAAVFRQYASEYRPRQIHELLETGGFSGARLWKVSTDAGLLCLRRWPTGQPDEQRLKFIHAVLKHVERNGFKHLPVPFSDQENNSFVVLRGAYWELTRWLPGVASYQVQPQREKLVHAFEALAHFHRASATFPDCPAEPKVSPGIQQRGNQLRELQAGGLEKIASSLQRAEDPVRRRGIRLLELFRSVSPDVAMRLAAAQQRPVRLQPCIRDIWHDHVLFTGVYVSGLIDFGAMRIDTVAGDVSRLLGSLAGDRPPERITAIEAYESLAPLNEHERALVEVFDQSSVLLSGMKWLQWICEEGKRFTEFQRVLTRLDEIINRLETANRTGGQISR